MYCRVYIKLLYVFGNETMAGGETKITFDKCFELKTRSFFGKTIWITAMDKSVEETHINWWIVHLFMFDYRRLNPAYNIYGPETVLVMG